MELFNVYLGHGLDEINAVTGFAVLQALAFTFWSQTDEFKDNLRVRPLIALGASLAMIVIFFCFYSGAIWILTDSQLTLLKAAGKPGDLGVPTLAEITRTSRGERIVAIGVFHLIAIAALARYFQGAYTLEQGREAATWPERKSFPAKPKA